MKTYIGLRTPNGCRVRIVEGREWYLRHRVRHSPTGLEWGYFGSGPTDTALSLLWDVYGEEPPPEVVLAFRDWVVADLPREGLPWSLTEVWIKEWVAEKLNYPPPVVS